MMEAGGLATPPISLFWAIPFASLLTAIALAPFINRHWWEKNYPWVAIGAGAIAATYYFIVVRRPARWLDGMADYVGFIVLLGSLFIVSGGISIKINRKATPLANCVLLLIGAVLANFFGTTGASMLLIRPYLRMNRQHLRPYHVVFFIFLVGNIGGALTPIGDPPLFLGYLSGIPFWWVFDHLQRIWLVSVGLLLLIFFILDTLDHRSSRRHHEADAGPQVHILGIHNFLFILLILVAVFQKGFFDLLHQMIQQGFSLALLGRMVLSREVLMVAATVLSRRFTSNVIYEGNEFTFTPIKEVAILFLGIFATMIPSIQYMQENVPRMPVHSPGQFYYGAGVLSAILDNAPTYKSFLELRLAQVDPADVAMAQEELERMHRARTLEPGPDVTRTEIRHAIEAVVQYHSDDVLAGTVTRDELLVAFLLGNPLMNAFIVAISAGSVLWGACTYIGNGPNFMIKSIADAAGARTPGFMRYIFQYTFPILLPLYVIIWAIFFLSW